MMVHFKGCNHNDGSETRDYGDGLDLVQPRLGNMDHWVLHPRTSATLGLAIIFAVLDCNVPAKP